MQILLFNFPTDIIWKTTNEKLLLHIVFKCLLWIFLTPKHPVLQILVGSLKNKYE